MTSRTRPALLVALALVVLVAGGVAGMLALRGGDDDGAPVDEAAVGADVGPQSPAAREAGPALEPVISARPLFQDPAYLEGWRRAAEAEVARKTQEAAATAYAAARRSDETLAREAIRQWGSGQLLLSLPSIGVTAAVSSLGFEGDGRTPATPNSAWGVGLYNFTSWPGDGGNAVMAGHVDWYTGAPAVFGRLQQVQLGDPIYMVLPDGTPVVYEIGRREWVTPSTADVGEIFGITAGDAVTIITCGGAWDPVARDYSHRLVVRAMRVR